jgi:hypothetical protein
MYTQKMTCRVRRDLGTMIRPVKHTGDDPCRVVDTPVNQLQGQVPATDAQVLLAPTATATNTCATASWCNRRCTQQVSLHHCAMIMIAPWHHIAIHPWGV